MTDQEIRQLLGDGQGPLPDDWQAPTGSGKLSDQEIRQLLGPEQGPLPDDYQTGAGSGSKPAIQQAPSGIMRELELAGTSFARGLSNLLGLPGDLAAAGHKAWPQLFQRSAGQLPTSEYFQGLLPGAGPHPELEPQGLGEKTLAGVAGGLGAALPFAPVGMSAALLAGGLGGLGGALGKETGLPGGELVGSLVGGAGAATGVAALAQLGLRRLATRLGTASTVQEGGEAAQEAARLWRNVVMPQGLARAAAPLDARMAPGSPVQLNNYVAALQDLQHDAGSLQRSVEVIRSRLPDRLLNSLQGTDALPLPAPGPGRLIQVQQPSGALHWQYQAPPPQEAQVPITWADARELRSQLGELTSNPKLIKDTDPRNIDRMYAALSQDLGQAAHRAGAGQEWDTFNRESSRLYQFAEGPLGRIIRDPNPAQETIRPENVLPGLISSGRRGGTDLQALRNEAPGVVNALAAAMLRTQPEAWRRLAPEARNALLPNPEDARLVDQEVARLGRNSVNLNNLAHRLTVETLGSVLAGSAISSQFGLGHNLPLLAGEVAAPALIHGLTNIRPGSLGPVGLGAIAGTAGNRTGTGIRAMTPDELRELGQTP